MAQITAKDLRLALVGVADDSLVTIQTNITGEEDKEGDEPSYTDSMGYVYSAFARKGWKNGKQFNEFVIDSVITASE